MEDKPVILLVDDSMMNRMMLAGILGEDYRILEAGNGKQCLELLRAKAGQISLVLLDINMPVMDGFEVLRTMNTNHTIEDVPVIMISSDDSEEAHTLCGWLPPSLCWISICRSWTALRCCAP